MYCTGHEKQREKANGALTKAVDNREAQRRSKDHATAEVQRYYTEQKKADVSNGNQLMYDMKRVDRESKERNAEAQMMDSLYQGEKARELSLIKRDEEERMANVLAKRANAAECREKEVQRLREQSSELKELSEKLRTARMNKERSLQLQERVQILAQQQEYDAAMNQYVAETDAAAVVREDEAQARRREQNCKARLVLEEQMQEKQEMMKVAESEAARERAMIDEVMRRIMAEDIADADLKHRKVEETKDFIAQFLVQQEEARRAREETREQEDRRIKEHWQMVSDRDAAEAERKVAQKGVADKMYEKVKAELEAQAAAKEEEEELINLLHGEELEERWRKEDAAKQQKAEHMRANMKRENEYQKRIKEERERQLKAEEEGFRQRMMSKFAEDDRIEQLNVQKRRMKLAEHQRAVQEMIDEKRRMYEEQKARDEADIATQRIDDERKLAIIEDERRHLLREAAELREFLPRGVIRDQADVDYINQCAAEHSGGSNGFGGGGGGAEYSGGSRMQGGAAPRQQQQQQQHSGSGSGRGTPQRQLSGGSAGQRQGSGNGLGPRTSSGNGMLPVIVGSQQRSSSADGMLTGISSPQRQQRDGGGVHWQQQHSGGAATNQLPPLGMTQRQGSGSRRV